MTSRNLREIGYEGRTLDDVVRTLCSWEVGTLVDVRLNAISRKKGFSKTALRCGLEDAGISYVHLPHLGNPKHNRDGFWDPGTSAAEAAQNRFRHLITTPEAIASLDLIESLAQNGGAAMLCFESRRSMCHRNVIAQELDARRLTLV